MAERWELICHHTYGGIPGVVVDRAPRRASPGVAVAPLADGDFLHDGATAGSGAVRFYKTGARVHVPIDAANAAAWQPLAGLRAEVTFRRDAHPAGAMPIDTLLEGGSFHLYVRGSTLVAWFRGVPTQYAEITSTFDPVGPQPYQVPTGAWTTVGFLHDGLGTLELSADGVMVARKQGVFAPVAGAGAPGIFIGNTRQGDAPLHGEIDEVKVWRLNPRRLVDEFFGRPMDEATARCWARIWSDLRAALARHPECVRALLVPLRNGIDRVQRLALARGPETRERLARSQREYRRLWNAGQVDSPEMTQLFADLIAAMRVGGVDPAADPDLAAVLDSECLRRILAEISEPDCDLQALALLRAIVARLGGHASRDAAAV
jgi:hypothetical protein